MSYQTECDGKVVIASRNATPSIVDTSAQHHLDWSKIRIGDRIRMVHPRGIGYSATYCWVHTFTVKAFKDGKLQVGGSGFFGYLTVPKKKLKSIKIEEEEDALYYDSYSSLNFKQSHIVEYEHIIKGDELGEEIYMNAVPKDTHFIVYRFNGYEKEFCFICENFEDFRKFYDTKLYNGCYLFYLLEDFEEIEFKGKKEKYTTLGYHRNNGKKSKFPTYGLISKYEDFKTGYLEMLEDKWEDEDYDTFSFLRYKVTNKYVKINVYER